MPRMINFYPKKTSQSMHTPKVSIILTNNSPDWTDTIFYINEIVSIYYLVVCPNLWGNDDSRASSAFPIVSRLSRFFQ